MDLELWTRDEGDIAPLLPQADRWQAFDGEFQYDADGWLVSVFKPERAEPGEIPPEVAALVSDLGFRTEIAVEPSDPPNEAWTLVRELLTSLGGALDGAGLDPESGRATTWPRSN